MKQEELGEASVWAKMFLSPDLKIGEAKRFSFFWEIKLAQQTIDPDVDRKGVEPVIGIQEDATGDFGADPGQGFEMCGGLRGGEGIGDGEEGGLGGEPLGGSGEGAGTVAKGAVAEGLFSRLGEGGGGGKRAGGASESGAQVGMDLANLGDLLEGGADKVHQALPRVLTKGTQARMLPGGGAEVGVGQELRFQEGGKIEIE